MPDPLPNQEPIAIPAALVVPPAIEAAIQDFNRTATPFNEMNVQQVLGKARGSLQNPSEGENFGAWAEVLAFNLADTRMQSSPWGTYFAPMGSGTDKDGKTVYFPDIAGADARVVNHWIDRAKTITHPVLRARYADLAWDLCVVIARMRRDPEMARLAIDAYLASVPSTVLTELHDRFGAALRALDLAVMIRDPARTERARAALLQLHRDVMSAHTGQWWVAVDRLIEDRNAGVTDAERQQLVADLEELVLHFGDGTKPENIDPHAVEAAANRLIKYYTRLDRPDDAKRLHQAIARAFEHFASLGNAMLAAAVLQTSVNSYRNAGMPEDSRRVRILMEEKIGQSRENMGSFPIEMKISRDDMESFLKYVVVDDLGSTFVRLASQFLPTRRNIEEEVKKSLKQAPLMAMMPRKIMADDHVAAKIGSVEDDPFGRLLQHTKMGFGISAVWLQAAMHRAIETHSVTAEHIVGWANRHGLFDDLTFLNDGVRAWYEGDLVKAVHVLVPQVELGLRSIVGRLGKPVTKPHPAIADVGVVLNMGDILYSPDLAEALGPDLTLYFLSLYADPRGMNLRNRVAHGMLQPDSIDQNLVRWLIHTLLVFGIWQEFAERRR